VRCTLGNTWMMCEASYLEVDSLKFDGRNWNAKVPANDIGIIGSLLSVNILGLCGLPYVAIV